jgi:hypothetical protein
VGRIVALSISYTAETGDGMQQATVDLETMVRYCRPERVEDLLDDLAVIFEDIRAGARPSLAVIWGRE